MTKHIDLAHADVWPEPFLDAFAEYMSSYGSPNLRLSSVGATVVLAAGTGDDQVSLAVEGRWRYNTANVVVSHPGGAAGSYEVWATATDNVFAPGLPEIDSTVYSFGLSVRAVGDPPSSALKRMIGRVLWNGTTITGVETLLGGVRAELPPGIVISWPVGTIPDGYVLCQGQELNRGTYARLFSKIGTSYGVGDGSSTFNVPNMQDRFMRGGTVDALAANNYGGAASVALTLATMPAHNHGGTSGAGGAHSHTVSSEAAHDHGGVTTGADGSHTHGGNTGSGGAHSHGITPGNPITITYSGVISNQNASGWNTPGYQAWADAPNHSHSITYDGSHTHTVNTAGLHLHTMDSPSHTHVGEPQGSGTAHENRHPFRRMHFLIKT